MVQEINEKEFNELDKSGYILLDFNATWCGPCQMLKPVLEEVSKEYEGKVRFYGIDTDQNQDLAVEYRVMSIPALVLLKDGQRVATNVGAVPADELCDFIDSNL